MELMHKNANKKINKNNMQYGIKKKTHQNEHSGL